MLSAEERERRRARQESYMRRIRAQGDLHNGRATGGAARTDSRSSSIGSLALADIADGVEMLELQPEGDAVHRTSTGLSGPHPSLEP